MKQPPDNPGLESAPDNDSLAEQPALGARRDRLDRELVRLLNERARLEMEPAAWSSFGLTEPAWLAELVANQGGPLSAEALRNIFRELESGIRAARRPLRVAYLGPPYSYSHLAAVERFGNSAELIPVGTIAAVFEEVTHRQVDFGLVPLENSTDGRVVDTLDRFARSPAQVCGEVPLRIHHHLLGKEPREQIREIYSKPQALSQCREWLARHMPAAQTVEITSTAAAAERAVNTPGVAAIASRAAATHYGLSVLAESIEDNRNNVTRFAVIGEQEVRRTGKDKTSLMFELPHLPGALADAMAIFKYHELNLTWIESFPMPGAPHEYLFFVEFEGFPHDDAARRALDKLREKTVRLEILGTYPRCSTTFES